MEFEFISQFNRIIWECIHVHIPLYSMNWFLSFKMPFFCCYWKWDAIVLTNHKNLVINNKIRNWLGSMHSLAVDDFPLTISAKAFERCVSSSFGSYDTAYKVSTNLFEINWCWIHHGMKSACVPWFIPVLVYIMHICVKSKSIKML